MARPDRHLLPRVGQRASFLYLEHAEVRQRHKAITVVEADGSRTDVPVAQLLVLLLGPGCSITSKAIQNLGEAGTMIAWTGEHGVRFYAHGAVADRNARNLLRQAELVTDPAARLKVVRSMYQFRFGERIDPEMTLQQIRGLEGVRVREAYARASKATGVPWTRRDYRRSNWDAANDINRALSSANATLYAISTAAILAAGYSPALGFIHTGTHSSFTFDVADLYKTDIAIPAAFEATAGAHLDRDSGDSGSLESRVRRSMRNTLRETRVLSRIVEDITTLLGAPDADPPGEAPMLLWDPKGEVQGGVNYGGDDADGHPA